MNTYCQIEHGASDSDVGTPCSNRAVATCSDCGVAICSDCRIWCCGQSFCQWCGDYHRAEREMRVLLDPKRNRSRHVAAPAPVCLLLVTRLGGQRLHEMLTHGGLDVVRYC